MKFSDALKKDFEIKKEDFHQSLARKGLSLPKDPKMEKSLEIVFGLSDFVARSCIGSPELLLDLVDSRDLFASYGRHTYGEKLEAMLAKISTGPDLKIALTRFRKREMVRIAWRDLCGWSNLSETVSDLSGFADSCIQESLDWLYEGQASQYGIPRNEDGVQQYLVVLGMGKLGTKELNFSSDIDLIFAFPEKGKTRGGLRPGVTNEEFFTRLARSLINALSASSAQGNLFRVDMRLRPYGENGPLVMTFDNMENYYQLQGREWERYAWVRARSITGHAAHGTELLARIKPFVYRRYLDYTVLDSLREMKRRIARDVRQKEMAHNVKLGPGGIREIEFFCQMFQILRGGITPSLQNGDTQSILKLLAEEDYITEKTLEELSGAYVFLRHAEHHLQEFKDSQVHTLPKDEMNKERLALSMGFESYAIFVEELNRLMEIAHGHFNLLLQPEKKYGQKNEAEDKLSAIWEDLKNYTNVKSVLIHYGYADPEKVLTSLNYLKDASETKALSPKGRQRVDHLIPMLLEQVGKFDGAEQILSRVIDLVKVIERRTNYIALLLENPSVLSHLIRLAGESAWIIKFLSQHPVLLDELLDPRTLYAPPEKPDLDEEIHEQLIRIPSDDVEYQIETLCIFKQTNVLRVAAADVTGVLPIMKVSDHLTDIAETVLGAVLKLAWAHLVSKHGLPAGCIENTIASSGFLVVGYGKLGGIEMGYRSDVDLVFLHTYSQGMTQGPNSIDNGYFYARLGQRIVHLLTTHTRAGVIYETDMRLRPSGNSGPLVSEINGFFDYQMKEGWTWEQQALVRARPICGDPELARRFNHIRQNVLSQSKDPKQLKQDVISMRNRMRNERATASKDVFDFKDDPGGIIDIEFLVQYLVLAYSNRYKNLLTWTDNVRLLDTLSENKLLTSNDAQDLKNTYLVFRSAIHKCNLQEIPPKAPIDQFCALRENVIKNWEKHLLKTTKM